MNELDIRCPSCESLIDEEDLFCANCGTQSPARQTASPAPMAGCRSVADRQGQLRVQRLRGIDELRRRGQSAALPLLRFGRTCRPGRPQNSRAEIRRPFRRRARAGRGVDAAVAGARILAAQGTFGKRASRGHDAGLCALLGLPGEYAHLLDRRLKPHPARRLGQLVSAGRRTCGELCGALDRCQRRALARRDA